MTSRFIFNETSYFGWGSREVIVDEINKRKFKKALLVTDSTLLKDGVTHKVMDILDNNSLEYEVFSDIVPNPTIANVKKGLKIANKYHVDYIIAVGGGSVIDTAKAIGIIFNNPEYKDVKSLAGVVDTKNKSLPIIAFPTTSGTAAEATINYVITDEEKKVKLVCVDPNSIPVLAIVDAELMSSMPISVLAATGMDALTHGIECFLSKGSNIMSDMFALKAINLVYKNIEKAANKERPALEKLAMAQYIAGMGFSNAGLGIVHSMAHQLGATYDIPHGVANALLLPYVLEYNGVSPTNKYVGIADALEIEYQGLNYIQIVNKVVACIKELCMRLDIPQHFSDFGGKEEDIHEMAKKAMEDPCTSSNPQEMTVEKFEELFEKAL